MIKCNHIIGVLSGYMMYLCSPPIDLSTVYKEKLKKVVSYHPAIKVLYTGLQNLIKDTGDSSNRDLMIKNIDSIHKQTHFLQKFFNHVKQQCTELMDYEFIWLYDNRKEGSTFMQDCHNNLYSLMEMAADFKRDTTRQMLLEACEKHPHFLNDIPYKLIPDAIKDDEHFIQQVHQLGQKFKESSKTMLAKDISNLQHYALWELGHAIDKLDENSTKIAFAAYLMSLNASKSNDLLEKVKFIKQRLIVKNYQFIVDTKIVELSFKYPKILNQRENLPTDVFNNPQQQDMLRQHYYFQLAKYTIGMSLGAGFAITGILALAGVLMFPYSISVVALVFGMIMLGTFIWSLQQDDFCAVMANHPFEAVPIDESEKYAYGVSNASYAEIFKFKKIALQQNLSVEGGSSSLQADDTVLSASTLVF